MEVKRLRTLKMEIFKILNNQNPSFMREIFYRSPYVSYKKQNLFVQSHKTAGPVKKKTPFIQFYIHFNNLTVLVKGTLGWGKLGGVLVLIRL